MVQLLSEQKVLLSFGGCSLVISASFLKRRKLVKEMIKSILALFGVYHRTRGQFWGWQRTRFEYRRLRKVAGYSRYTDGFIDSKPRTYFIKGHV